MVVKNKKLFDHLLRLLNILLQRLFLYSKIWGKAVRDLSHKYYQNEARFVRFFFYTILNFVQKFLNIIMLNLLTDIY